MGPTESRAPDQAVSAGRAPRPEANRMTNQPWETLPYRRIARAVHRHGNVLVRFENGDEVPIEPARLLPAGVQAPDWDHMTCDGIEIEVPTQDGPHHVFWESI